ncbi:MAG: DHH family phosphoesterase [Deltaproteobacteria bacterium]|nr:DHH family phosphoesterase [Deltaproteobacteria bacterium]
MSPKPEVLPRSNRMVEKLNRFYNVFHSDDHVLIIINADPDAIACAMAIKRLLWRRVTTVTIARVNIIKRSDNLALLSFIKLPLVPFSDIDQSKFTRLVTVDSQPHHFIGLTQHRFDAVIDHHPKGDWEAAFADIRPEYGATATILTEYLRAARIKPSRNLATALFYAIKTDTDNFVRQGQLGDVLAFRYLFPLKYQSVIAKIEHSEFNRAVLKHFQRALELVQIKKGTAFLYFDVVDTPDLLVMLADFFMHVHEINRVIMAGIYMDRLIVIFRVIGPHQNAGQLASSSFGQFGSAGGHKSMARAEIPLANLDHKLLERDGALERFIQRRILKPGMSSQALNASKSR